MSRHYCFPGFPPVRLCFRQKQEWGKRTKSERIEEIVASGHLPNISEIYYFFEKQGDEQEKEGEILSSTDHENMIKEKTGKLVEIWVPGFAPV